jgi:hypothetical protein
MAVLDGVEAESIVVKFFGIFFFFFQCNSIVGHIISTGGRERSVGGSCLYLPTLSENMGGGRGRF